MGISRGCPRGPGSRRTLHASAVATRVCLRQMTIPKQQRTKADLVYEALQSSIMSGNIREGEHLRQEEVAARLGVSQTPVREAFRRLESEGLVEHAPNRGIIVRGIPWSPPPSPLDVIARRWGELVNDPDRIPGSDFP